MARQRRAGLVTAAVALALLPAALLPGSAISAPSDAANGARLESTVRFLQGAQNLDGGFGGAPGAESGSMFTAWVALALAAAGVNPRDQALPGGSDAYSYLLSHYSQGIAESDCAPTACTTIFERELMVVNAAGGTPRDFGGVDLVGELLARARPDGSFPHVPGGEAGVNDTIFAIFALAPVAEAVAQAPIQGAADWIESAQQEVGGWAWKAGSAAAEVDMTGAAIQALAAAGRPAVAAVQRGLAYLRAAQNPDGGFPMFPGEPESNSASSCWAVQAIWAAGQNPEAWLTGSGLESEEPLDFLESLQADDGHIRWKRDDDLNGVWMTAYCAPALAGQAWPIPQAPRSIDQIDPPQAGEGGGTQAGGGVMAGGGGGGAPVFSRPKPQSKGKTPGGARTVKRGATAARNHSRTRRGENARQPRATQKFEATSAPAGSPAAAGDAAGGEQVIGTLVGSTGERSGPHFGAPGLDGAGVKSREQASTALAIGLATLLAGIAGWGWERRRQEVLP